MTKLAWFALAALMTALSFAGCDCGAPVPAAVCGDGAVDDGEACDDGNTADGDGCSADCTSAAACGDGTVDTGEACDDGNVTAGDGCASDCTLECGNDVIDGAEECDGADLGGADCASAGFFEGVLACDAACALDTSACTNSGCGNSALDAGEQCDDGNAAPGDGCDAACLLEGGPGCGNGVFDGREQCDDGNLAAGDGCAPDCTIEGGVDCGDGVIDTGEQCDDANDTPDDGCENNCTLTLLVTCGDGVVDTGEQCDDGNIVSGDGCAANCFDDAGGFEVTDSDPQVVSRVTGATINVFGTGMIDVVTMQLEDCFDIANPPVVLAVGSVDSSGESVQVTLAADLNLKQSLYRFAATNGDGQQAVSDCILTISALPPPTVTDVSPPFSFAGRANDGILSDATVQLTGTGFNPTPAVTFVSTTDASISFQAPIVAFVSEGELSVVVPSESQRMALGTYFVLVTNPDGLQAQWLIDLVPGLFEVRDVAPPTITSIDPLRDAGVADVTLTLTGSDFQDGARVFFILDDQGNEREFVATFVDANTITALIPGNDVVDGAYPVKVLNPDGQFDIFFVYEQTNSSEGHLNQDPFVNTGRTLVVGRERHGVVEGFDLVGQSHIYVVGGMDADKAMLNSVERAQVSIFGNAAPFEIVQQYTETGSSTPNDDLAREPDILDTARAGLSVVRAGNFLYAIGGTTEDPLSAADTPALNTIERARILGFETQPFITQPQVLAGNGLANGVWFYRVSAVSNEGESLSSREVTARGGGTIRVCWSSPVGATSFNIYRSPAADGRFGTTRLLVTELAPVPDANGVLCLDDNGGNDVASGLLLTPAPGRLAGSLLAGGSLADGLYTYRVAAVRDGVETVAGYASAILVDTVQTPGDQTITLRWDVIPDATYNLYRSPVAGDPAGSERLLAAGLTNNSFTDDGTATFADLAIAPRDGVQVLPAGSLTKWQTLPLALTQPREGPDAVVLTAFDGNPLTTDDPTFLYVAGGKTSHQAVAYLATTERARVDGGTGNLVNPIDDTAITLAEDTTHLLSFGRAYFPLLTNQGQFVTPFPPPPQEPPCGDVDGDGFDDAACGGDDCNDADPNIHPGANEQCQNGVDDDCDFLADCADTDAAPNGCAADTLCTCDPALVDIDLDGHLAIPCGDDCDDSDPDAFPGNPEVCTSTTDDDCDGLVDCFDTDDCSADASCADFCSGVVDGDGDGDLADPCGLDCNDGDITICSDPDLCPEVNCDGIDQDCDGVDLCIIGGPAPGGGGVGPLSTGATVRPLGVSLFPESDDPIFLVACSGDKDFSASANRGSSDFEVTTIDRATGELVGWVVESEPQLSGQGTFGHDALLYFSFVFSFPGVASETVGVEPSPEAGTISRFPFDEEQLDVSLVMDRFQSASASLTVSRAYYSLLRLNARIFAIGGNDGSGATNVVDVHQQ